MSLVVSDASPLHYLILCEAIEVLPRLFDHVIIPRTVYQELQHEKTPPLVRQWMQGVPPWASVRSGEPIVTQVALDAGEREALGLIDLSAVVAKLRQTNIFLAEDIIQETLARVAAAKDTDRSKT